MSVTANNPAGIRTILLASPRSFCAGVERAIAVVEQLLDQRGGPISVRKQIVHNTHVVAELQARGAVFVDKLDTVPHGAIVVFSAHGVSPAVRTEAASRGLEAIAEESDLVLVVGLTAGASAPPQLVDAVIAALAQFGPVTVVERETTHETVHFTLPAAVRRS